MTMCEALTDRMPEVAHGRSAWSGAEQDHLDSCAACRAEWALLSRVGALGGGLAVDPARVTAGVLQRVERERAVRRTAAWQSPAAQLVTLAAAAAILLAVVSRERVPAPDAIPAIAETPASGVLQLAELDSAAPDELQAVLAVFDVPPDPATSLNGADLEGMTDSQVESALRSWEES